MSSLINTNKFNKPAVKKKKQKQQEFLQQIQSPHTPSETQQKETSHPHEHSHFHHHHDHDGHFSSHVEDTFEEGMEVDTHTDEDEDIVFTSGNPSKLLENNLEIKFEIMYAFLECCQRGELEKVKAVVESGLIDLDYIQENKDAHLASQLGIDYTGLMWAVQYNQTEIVKYLLHQGCKINKQSPVRNVSALHLAIMNQNLEIIKLLFMNGADYQLEDMYGRNALRLALEHQSSSEIIEYLERKYSSSQKEAIYAKWKQIETENAPQQPLNQSNEKSKLVETTPTTPLADTLQQQEEENTNKTTSCSPSLSSITTTLETRIDLPSKETSPSSSVAKEEPKQVNSGTMITTALIGAALGFVAWTSYQKFANK